MTCTSLSPPCLSEGIQMSRSITGYRSLSLFQQLFIRYLGWFGNWRQDKKCSKNILKFIVLQIICCSSAWFSLITQAISRIFIVLPSFHWLTLVVAPPWSFPWIPVASASTVLLYMPTTTSFYCTASKGATSSESQILDQPVPDAAAGTA